MDGIFAEMSMDVLRRRMADLTGVDLGGELELEAGDGLQIDWAGGRGKIAGESGPAICRGLFLLSCHVRPCSACLTARPRWA